MKILTPVGAEKLNKAKYNARCKCHNFAEWCSNHLVLVVFAVFCWTATPFMVYIAYIERGYKAFGGEWLIPLIPFFVLAIGKAIEDDRRN